MGERIVRYLCFMCYDIIHDIMHDIMYDILLCSGLCGVTGALPQQFELSMVASAGETDCDLAWTQLAQKLGLYNDI